MNAIRATFDGSRVILPPEASGHQPGTVIVIFEDDRDDWDGVDQAFLAAQEATLAKVWDYPGDAIYDEL